MARDFGSSPSKASGSSIPSVKEGPSKPPTQNRSPFPKGENSSVSRWLDDVKHDPLLNHRSTPELPKSAEIVIIGSGITGTLVASHCHSTWPGKSIVVLEARQFCSGATGRNAGHCKPDQWRGFRKYEQAFGTQQALKILQNEQQTWMDLVQYVHENNVDCDLWTGDTLDVPMTPEVAKNARDVFEDLKAAGGNVDHIKVTQDPTEAAKVSRIKDAQACYAWPASTLQPWKLTAHIMRENIKKGVNLQTCTQARSVRPSSQSPDKWTIETERGEIECSQVVYATNAYTSALQPDLRGLIQPSPHICSKLIPPSMLHGSERLQNSYGVLLPGGALFSINPRSNSDGVVLFGGSNPGQVHFEQWIKNNPARSVDDGLVDFEPITEAVREFTKSQLLGWEDGSTGPGEGYSRSWSGIIALSADSVPFVGQLPGLPGQWICAGHHGHGMARIFTAAPGLVKLMGGSSWADTKLPEVFQITPSRIEGLKSYMAGGRVSPRL